MSSALAALAFLARNSPTRDEENNPTIDAMTTRCVDKLYQNAGNLALIELLGEKKNARVLDCGCGAGDNAAFLNSARDWTVTGITISPSEQQAASVYCDKVYLADLELGLPKEIQGEFDFVLMSHVLEHLVHPENLLHDIKTVIVPDGIIAVALPNVLVYYNRLRFLLGRFEYTDGDIMDETHVRFYTFVTGARLLESNGYKLLDAQSEGAFPLWKLRHILPGRFVKTLNHFVTKHWPGFFGWQSLYLASVAR